MSFLVSNLTSYHNKFMKFWYSKTDITKWLYQFDISNRLSKMEEVFLIIFTIFKMCVSGKIHLSFTDNIPHVFNIKGIVPLVQAVPIFWHKVLMYMYIYRCLHLFHHITISNGRSQFFFLLFGKNNKRPRDYIAHLDNYRRTKIWALWSDLYSVISNCKRCIIIQKIINRERIEICTSCSKKISDFSYFLTLKLDLYFSPWYSISPSLSSSTY